VVETLGVLVAGGAGERLKAGVPKALAPLGGMTLLERAARALASVADEVVVAAPPLLVLPLSAAVRARGGSTLRRIGDRPGATGPLAGMVAGLLDQAPPFACALVLGVDFPFMEPAFLTALLERLGDAQAVVPAPAGIIQPLAAAYAPAAAAILATCHAAGEGAPTRALRTLTVRRLDDAEIAHMPGGHACLINLNTPDDWAQAERRMAARAAR
jgi:molybdopterin-guanine dinucleotide biosynthesis protein A